MNAAAAALMAIWGLWPDFARAPGLEPAVSLWETPVALSAPYEPPPDFPAPASGLPSNIDEAKEKTGQGDLAGAQAAYEKILAAAGPGDPARSPALSGLKKILARRAAAGEKAAYSPWLQTLKAEWRNEEALALAALILADPAAPAEAKTLARKLEPLFNLRLGRFDRAAELWGSPKTAYELKWLAETERRRGRFAQAAGLRLGAPARPGGPALTPDPAAAFIILTQGGLYKEAGALAEKHPALKKHPDYGWRLGLAALGAGENAAAAVLFETLAAAAGRRREGARYFWGRALAASGRTAEAEAAYSQAARGPAGYYRLLAEGRLLKAAPGDPAPLFAPLLAGGPSGLDRDRLGFHLWITEKSFSGDGLAGAAAALEPPILAGRDAAELNALLTLKLTNQDWAGLLELIRDRPAAIKKPAAALWPPIAAAVAARGGDYRLAIGLLAKIKGGGGPQPPKSAHPLIFCRPVLEAWRRHGLSPALVLALIRAESAYQPRIISASNARGLMQLLPATAARTALALEEAPPEDEDLFRPELNIRHGSWYLAALKEGFGHEALALAGYNGGPHNIKSLILARPGLPLDIFIESLWSEETVDYVKRVMAGRYVYELAYTGRAVRPDLTRPVRPPQADLPDF